MTVMRLENPKLSARGRAGSFAAITAVGEKSCGHIDMDPLLFLVCSSDGKTVGGTNDIAHAHSYGSAIIPGRNDMATL